MNDSETVQVHQAAANLPFEADNDAPQTDSTTLLLPATSHENIPGSREDHSHPTRSPSDEYRITRKPVAATPNSAHEAHEDNAKATTQPHPNETSKPEGKQHSKTIYWLTPATVVAFFMLGLGTAIGHHFFLQSLNDRPASNQKWITRYSLAMAFVVKFSLSAATSLAFVQRMWHTLQQTRRGVTVINIDGLFTAQESILPLLTFDLWRTAFLATLMATIVWLMPLAALISPTALSVGSLTQLSSISSCLVPTLNMTNQDRSSIGTSLSLSTTDYTGNVFNPSMTARRIVGTTCLGGQQIGWPSPCGSNCTYNVSFVAPSMKCTRTPNIDDPRAPWTIAEPAWGGNSSYWFVGYGSGYNYTIEAGSRIYDPVYYGGLNPNESQFWAGVSNTLASDDLLNETVAQGLDIHVYICDFMNTSYSIRVNYTNGQQTNEVRNITHINRVEVPSTAWDGDTAKPSSIIMSLSLDTLDIVSLYQILISTINGTIDRDPRETLSDETTISLVHPLCSQFNGSTHYGMAELAVPYLEIGPLIEQLTHNISISLLSEQRLQVVNPTTTTCAVSTTTTVWKYSPMPLVAAYAAAVFLTLLCLGVGAHAMLSTGCARDTTFSTVVRTTRSPELDVLSSSPDDGALPLDEKIEKTRLSLLTEPGGRVAFHLF